MGVIAIGGGAVAPANPLTPPIQVITNPGTPGVVAGPGVPVTGGVNDNATAVAVPDNTAVKSNVTTTADTDTKWWQDKTKLYWLLGGIVVLLVILYLLLKN